MRLLKISKFTMSYNITHHTHDTKKSLKASNRGRIATAIARTQAASIPTYTRSCPCLLYGLQNVSTFRISIDFTSNCSQPWLSCGVGVGRCGQYFQKSKYPDDFAIVTVTSQEGHELKLYCQSTPRRVQLKK